MPVVSTRNGLASCRSPSLGTPIPLGRSSSSANIMDGLEEFEKALADEQAHRERKEHHLSRHRHDHRRHQHDRHRNDASDKDSRGHRGRDDSDRLQGKRRRNSREGDDDEDHRQRYRRSHYSRGRQRGENRHLKRSDPKGDMPLPEDEKPARVDTVEKSASTTSGGLACDAWTAAPSVLDVEHVHRPKCSQSGRQAEGPLAHVIHKRELNTALQASGQADHAALAPVALQHTVDYTFGDEGSSWRMTKLKAVYTTAEESFRSVDEVALERYGTLQEFDDAREEKDELERRQIYEAGYEERDRPTGELYRQRLREDPAAEATSTRERGTIIPAEAPKPAVMDPTTLNRLRAQMMKAKLRRAPDAARLEEEYNRVATAAAAAEVASSPSGLTAVVLGAMESRQLAGTRREVKAIKTRCGRARGAVEERDDMSIEDMIREERRTKGQSGGEGKRLAERIAKDSRFANDLEYLDENTARLARRVHKSKASLKSMAAGELHRMNRVLDRCPLCHDEETGRRPAAPVVSLGTRVFLTLPTQPEVSEGGALIVPLAHRTNLLECDDDEWEEVRNFMKSLTRLYHAQGRDVVFYENAGAPQRRAHAAMAAAPIPYAEGATAPAFFREAFLAAGSEWAQHAKVIDTAARARDGGLDRMAFRRSLAREMPYFHAWFGLDGGLGHVVDDAARWPRGDLFAREILGAIVGADPHVVKKHGCWQPDADAAHADAWRRAWRKFDWTRVLVDGADGPATHARPRDEAPGPIRMDET